MTASSGPVPAEQPDPGTVAPPDGAGILGRALMVSVERHGITTGTLWREAPDAPWEGEWWYGGGYGHATRAEVEAEAAEVGHGPVREVLLVDPAVWPVVEAARAWRAQFAPGPDPARMPRRGALIAAVDALDTDVPAVELDLPCTVDGCRQERPCADHDSAALDLAAIEARANAATPGPWERGHVWLRAGVMPELFGAGRCAYCNHAGEPVWVGRMDINGRQMLAHRHRDPDPYEPDHLISGPDGEVAGNYDYEAGGIIAAADAEFVAHARTDVPRLVARVRQLEADLADAHSDLERVSLALDTARGWSDLKEGELAGANAQRDAARAEVERLRARVAELEQQAWQLRDAMTDQHEAIGHALDVHAFGEDCKPCIAAADETDGDLACDQWQRWQASYEAATALKIGPRPPSASPPETVGCAHHDRRCETTTALCLVDCTPPETAGGGQA